MAKSDPFKKYMNRPDITPKIREKIVSECYGTDTYEIIAKRYNISIGFVGYLKQKWDRENLYGQNTGR